MSRIDPKKGLVHLAEALALLVGRDLEAELWVVGAADADAQEYAEALSTRIDSLGVADRVQLLGRRTHEEVRGFLAAADVWVASAIEGEDGDKDGIPTALLEAMASGLPIVTTDAGSIVEVVEDGVSALVVPEKDPAALADALERVMTDGALAERLGRAAERRVRAEFDVAICERRFHTRLRELLRN